MNDREAITIFAINNFLTEGGPCASVETLRFFNVNAQIQALKALRDSSLVSSDAVKLAREVLAALEA